MTHEIVYRHRMEYDTRGAGVVLPVLILAKDRAEAVNAAVDTGSTLCVFQREIAERLGISVMDEVIGFRTCLVGAKRT